MKNVTSLIGWILLLLILVVPVVLFYNWWSSKKDEQQSQNVSYKTLSDRDLFKEQQENKVVTETNMASVSKQLTMSVSVSTPSQSTLLKTTDQWPSPTSLGISPNLKTSIEKENIKSTAVYASDMKSSSLEDTRMSMDKREFKSTSSTETVHEIVSYYEPKTSRDPTLSPDDYARIEEQKRARLEYERQLRLMELKKQRESNPVYKLRLQGIVGGARGKNNAIINGEMFSEGGKIMGAKIVKIGTNYVIMEYKGKKYKRLLR